MNIEFLRNFVKLTQYKSFSELAKDLSVSQSTLSHQISQLEKEFRDIKLINRTTRSFKLTKEGEILLTYAKKIIKLYDSCREELSVLSKILTEDIYITASTLPGSHILPKFIMDFKNSYPDVNIKISINNSKESIDLLNKNIIDFAGIGSFMDHNSGSFMDHNRDLYDVIEIGEDRIVFICSPDHKLAKKDQIKFAELIEYPFISREKGSGTRDVFEQQFPEYNRLNTKFEINDNDSIISAVSDSDHISILSEIIAKKAQDANLIKILKVKEYSIVAKRSIYFIKLIDKQLSTLKKKLWEYLKP
ncbi:MAG: LysR substrate-binding domain-containing protein [Promethearchaeota archaeon]